MAKAKDPEMLTMVTVPNKEKIDVVRKVGKKIDAMDVGAGLGSRYQCSDCHASNVVGSTKEDTVGTGRVRARHCAIA